jgi:predicted Zn finger-like uncharacterized protein
MTIVCPHCAAPAAFAGEPASPAGRMMRCARCGTNWLGRFHADDPYGGGNPGPVARQRRPRFERIIEHTDPDFAEPGQIFGRAYGRRPAPRKPPVPAKTAPRRGLAAWSGVGVATVLAALATVTFFNSTGVDAAPERGVGRYAGLEVRLLEHGLEVLGDGRAVAVSGEIVNRSGGVLDVPAVRVALKAKGAELYTWTVQPATARLAAGGSIRFRSALAASPSGIDEVAFRLADRQEFTVGMR